MNMDAHTKGQIECRVEYFSLARRVAFLMINGHAITTQQHIHIAAAAIDNHNVSKYLPHTIPRHKAGTAGASGVDDIFDNNCRNID